MVEERRAGNDIEMLRLFVESVQDYAIFLLDPDGHVATWNAGAQRIKGWTADEIVGRHFSVFYPPEAVAAGVPDQVLAAARREGRVEFDGWRVRKDGTRFWATVVITAIHDRDGRLRGFGKVTRDTTERRAANIAIRQREEQLAEAQRIAHLGSWEWDVVNGTLAWSAEMYRICGLHPEDVVPTYERYLECVHPEDRAGVDGAVQQAYDNRRGFSIEHRIVRPDGTVRYVQARGRLLVDDHGQPTKMVGTGHDVTEERQALEHRQELEDMRRRHREALDINDAIVQGLVVADLSLELGEIERAESAVRETLDAARDLVRDLLADIAPGGVRPGDLRRQDVP